MTILQLMPLALIIGGLAAGCFALLSGKGQPRKGWFGRAMAGTLVSSVMVVLLLARFVMP